MSRGRACVVMIFTATIAVTGRSADDLCSDVLRDGLFATEEFRDASSTSESFFAWQCSTSFKSHQEAIDAGLKVGTVVYGVPLKVGGTWDQGEVTTWKNQNCSQKQTTTDIAAATYRLIEREAPGILAAWSGCMDAKGSPKAINCQLTRAGKDAVFSANWRRTAGEPVASVPRVKSWQVAGGLCNGVLDLNSDVGEAARQVKCTPNEDETLVVMLETTRDSCWKTAEAEVSRTMLQGKIVLNEPTTYQADVVELSPNLEIVTNGHDLVISAEKKLILAGSPRIVSFEPDGNRPAGSHGRSAGPIAIQAPTVEGSRLFIANFGEDGAQGAKGARGARGSPGARGRGGRISNPLRGCTGRRDGTNGGRGAVGGQGLVGGDAGNGGGVTIAVDDGLQDGPVQRIVVETSRLNPRTNKKYECSGPCAGVPGAGGPGGDGGPGGPGGAGARGHDRCGSGGAGSGGPPGSTGPIGNEGRPGTAGSALFL
jgi:hypothetical protein